jgi:hypothetical protein
VEQLSKLKIALNPATCPMFSLDVLFCHVDDFCQAFEAQWHKQLLNHEGIKRIRAKSL